MNKLITLPILFFWMSICLSQETDTIQVLSPEDFKKEIQEKELQLMDVRTPAEYLNGHIEKSVNINFYKKEEFINATEKLDKNKPIYVYCHSGGRSTRASKLLKKLGFRKIIDLKGGYKAWRKRFNKP